MQEFFIVHKWIIWLAVVWTIPWKGVALWKSARNNHKIWFVTLFLLNTLAILDIFYIFILSNRKKSEAQNYNRHFTSISKNNINFIQGL